MRPECPCINPLCKSGKWQSRSFSNFIASTQFNENYVSGSPLGQGFSTHAVDISGQKTLCCGGPVMGIVGCGTASLVCTHSMPASSPSPKVMITKMFPDTTRYPTRGRIPPHHENHWSRDSRHNNDKVQHLCSQEAYIMGERQTGVGS